MSVSLSCYLDGSQSQVDGELPINRRRSLMRWMAGVDGQRGFLAPTSTSRRAADGAYKIVRSVFLFVVACDATGRGVGGWWW